jgi:hypothetical protein
MNLRKHILAVLMTMPFLGPGAGVALAVTPPDVHLAPSLVTPLTVEEGHTQIVSFVATPGQGQPVHLTSLQAPPFCSFAATGVNSGRYTCTPQSPDGGTFTLKVRGEENGLTDTASVRLTVIDPAVSNLVLTIAMQGLSHPLAAPLPLRVTLRNAGHTALVVSEGVATEPLHMDLVFRHLPNGFPLRPKELSDPQHAADRDGGPPVQPRWPNPGGNGAFDVAPVEELPGPAGAGGPFFRGVTIPDVHTFYDVNDPGVWSVQAVVRLGTSTPADIVGTANGVQYARAPLNPAEIKSPVIYFKLQ